MPPDPPGQSLQDLARPDEPQLTPKKIDFLYAIVQPMALSLSINQFFSSQGTSEVISSVLLKLCLSVTEYVFIKFIKIISKKFCSFCSLRLTCLLSQQL